MTIFQNTAMFTSAALLVFLLGVTTSAEADDCGDWVSWSSDPLPNVPPLHEGDQVVTWTVSAPNDGASLTIEAEVTDSEADNYGKDSADVIARTISKGFAWDGPDDTNPETTFRARWRGQTSTIARANTDTPDSLQHAATAEARATAKVAGTSGWAPAAGMGGTYGSHSRRYVDLPAGPDEDNEIRVNKSASASADPLRFADSLAARLMGSIELEWQAWSGDQTRTHTAPDASSDTGLQTGSATRVVAANTADDGSVVSLSSTVSAYVQIGGDASPPKHNNDDWWAKGKASASHAVMVSK